MCKFEASPDGLAVLLTEDLLKELNLPTDFSFKGRHLMVAGTFKESGKGPYLQPQSKDQLAFSG